MPVISVLMPCRNAAHHFYEAARSLSAQSFADFEVIAVNDGSTDATPELLDDWASRDGRVRVVHSAATGIVGALQVAADAAGSPFLARMDADDIAHPRRLETQLALLTGNPAIAACGSRIRYFPRSAVREGARRYERWINALIGPDEIARDLFVECPIPHPTLMIRREAFDRAGGYADRGWPEDYDLIFRIHAAGLGLAKTRAVLLDWRERPDRLSRTDPRYGADAFRRCKVHYLREILVQGRDVVVWGAGPVGKAFARCLVAGGVRLAAFVDLDPRKIGQTIHGVPVLKPAQIASVRGCFVVAAVGSASARAEIRAALAAARWREIHEYCAVA